MPIGEVSHCGIAIWTQNLCPSIFGRLMANGKKSQLTLCFGKKRYHFPSICRVGNEKDLPEKKPSF
jgi:hypothetical protein